MQVLELPCDVLVLGGGLGGCAAALAAARMGCRVCLTEENHWLGGQCTSQGVSALDEHQYIESFGGTASYAEFRRLIRAYYRDNFRLSPDAQADAHFNPGAGWVSRLCFEPKAGLGALLHLLFPQVESGRLQLFYRARVVAAQVVADRILSVTVSQPEFDRHLRFHPSYVLDATELGDLLPLLDIPYVSGAESREQTGEPHARSDGPAPHLVQSFTMPFVVDYRPGEDHTIPKPSDYEYNRDHQPYTLTLRYSECDLTYKVFEPVPKLPGAFWTYRRLVAAHLFEPRQFSGDLAMINWPGNDYQGGNLIDVPPQEQARLIEEAKNLSLGLLYWLQTEVPRDEGKGRGYPGLRLRKDVLGTADGLSQYPYIRESRRIQALRTVREQDVSAACQPGARAEFFADSVGLGFYPIDIHGVPGDVAAAGPTKPFQIPLGALIPRHLGNLLPACKNLGVTHLTNGCYRLHPVEWNAGESAGLLAAFCLARQQQPAAVFFQPELLHAFQRELLRQGIPLYWYKDLPASQPVWTAAQLLALTGTWPGDPAHLRFDPDTPASPEQTRQVCQRAGIEAPTESLSRGELARRVAAERFGLEY
jgi:hypothetical protein